MRFDDFTREGHVTVRQVDQLAGFEVRVGLPVGWEPFDSNTGIRVWVCRSDPYIDRFCANAVLTMHRAEAPVDAGDVFTMLAEQRVQSVPACHGVRREFAAATEGAGVVGVLAMEIDHELGTIDSVSTSRIITTGQATLIAEVTVSALRESPAHGADIWLTARPASAQSHGGVPATSTRQRGR